MTQEIDFLREDTKECFKVFIQHVLTEALMRKEHGTLTFEMGAVILNNRTAHIEVLPNSDGMPSIIINLRHTNDCIGFVCDELMREQKKQTLNKQ